MNKDFWKIQSGPKIGTKQAVVGKGVICEVRRTIECGDSA